MKQLLLTFVMLLSFAMGAVADDSDYYRRKAESYTHEAEYYQKRADSYYREAEYHLKRAENYQDDAAYYTKRGDSDRARTYMRYAETKRKPRITATKPKMPSTG